jgi:cell division GTPase FtsZ
LSSALFRAGPIPSISSSGELVIDCAALAITTINITGGNDLSMFEIDEAAKIITEACDPNANIIFGTTIDENFAEHCEINGYEFNEKGELL